MWHVDDGELHAYLDGELDVVAGARSTDIEAHLAVCESCGARLEQARRYRSAARSILRAADPGTGGAPPFEMIVRRARRNAATGIRPWWRSTRTLTWAASITLAIGTGWFAHAALEPHATHEAEGPEPQPRLESATMRSIAETPAEPASGGPTLANLQKEATSAARTGTSAPSEEGDATPEPTRIAAGKVQDAGSGTPSAVTGARVPGADTAERTPHSAAAESRGDAAVRVEERARAVEERALAVGPRGLEGDRIDSEPAAADAGTLEIAEPRLQVARSIDAPAPAASAPSMPAAAPSPIASASYANGIATTSRQPATTVLPTARDRQPPVAALGRRGGLDPRDAEPRTSVVEQNEAAETGRLLARVVSAVAGAIDGKGSNRGGDGRKPMDDATVPTVRGWVLEEGNAAALIGTQILLIAEDGKPVRTTRADLQGAFVFRNVEPGTYHVAANRSGYELRPRRIVVEDRADVVLELHMRPVPPDDELR